MNTPTSAANTSKKISLRKTFEEKKVGELNEKEKVDFIVSTLKGKHKEKVDQYNDNRIKTFGSILLFVNYANSELIDRLGGGSLGMVDGQDGVIAFIMGYSESVQGHGVRYLCEYGLCKDGKIVSTGPMAYRGAYASEQDHREKYYNTIKILSVQGDKVTFGVQSAQQLLIREWNTTGNFFTTKETYDLAEEQRVAEEKKLAKTLTTGWKENLENIRKLISNQAGNLESIENPFITETFAIYPVVRYDRNMDASDRSYKLYIIGDKYKEPKLIHSASCNYSPKTSGRFFQNKARFSFEQKDKDTLAVHITYRHGDYSSVPGYAYTLSEEDVIVKIPQS